MRKQKSEPDMNWLLSSTKYHYAFMEYQKNFTKSFIKLYKWVNLIMLINVVYLIIVPYLLNKGNNLRKTKFIVRLVTYTLIQLML